MLSMLVSHPFDVWTVTTVQVNCQPVRDVERDVRRGVAALVRHHDVVEEGIRGGARAVREGLRHGEVDSPTQRAGLGRHRAPSARIPAASQGRPGTP